MIKFYFIYFIFIFIYSTFGCIHNEVQSIYRIKNNLHTPLKEERRDIPINEWEYIKIKTIYMNTDILKDEVELAISYISNSLKVHSSNVEKVKNLLDNKLYDTEGHDIVIFITNENTYCKNNILGYAIIFEIDDYTGRPLSGTINICDITSNIYDIILHEMMHILGFSKNLPSFKLNIKQILGIKGTINGLIPKFVGINSKKYGRKYFNCPILNGIQLEGDESHLKKRLFYDDIMSPILSDNPIHSKLSFSILSDLPFYHFESNITYQVAKWGRGLGCGFINMNCLQFHEKYPNYSPYCFNNINNIGCNYNKKTIGCCGVVKYKKEIPFKYRYFVHKDNKMLKDPYLGGKSYMDFCPIIQNFEECKHSSYCYGETKCFDGIYECLNYECNPLFRYKYNKKWYDGNNTFLPGMYCDNIINEINTSDNIVIKCNIYLILTLALTWLLFFF